jgi:hypothetical protein
VAAGDLRRGKTSRAIREGSSDERYSS